MFALHRLVNNVIESDVTELGTVKSAPFRKFRQILAQIFGRMASINTSEDIFSSVTSSEDIFSPRLDVQLQEHPRKAGL